MKKSLLVSLLLLLAGVVGVFGQNRSFTYDADGNMESRYVVTLRSTTDAEEKNTTDITSIEWAERKITIYPNPTQGRIAVKISPLDTEQQNFLRLYDMNGKLLKTLSITTGLTELDIAGAPGIYLLNIHLGEAVSKWKIIKQ